MVMIVYFLWLNCKNREESFLKSKLLGICMKAMSFAAMFCAVFIANTVCPLAGYQDKEPESVRKLRKF